MTPPRQLVTLAVRKLLATHASLKVYSGFVPETPSLPLAVLHSIAGGGYDGPPLTDPTADASYSYQFDVVGTRVDQVEKGRDELEALIYGRGPSGAFLHALEEIPGWDWMDRLPGDTPGGVEVVKAPSGTICTATSRITVVLTPSS